jgi:hypothetical protein
MRSTKTRGGADRPTVPAPLRRTGSVEHAGAGGARPDLREQALTRGSMAWLALALVGMIVTFAFGLWLAQSARPQPTTPTYDPVTRPVASSPPVPAAVAS